MRWRRRTDDARRMKGDPPPTYAQLVAEIRLTQAALAKAEEVAANLRHQCDGLIRENARLRARALPQLAPLAVRRWTPVDEAAIDMVPDPGLSMRVDEDVTPYIPDYGVPATEDPTVLDYDPWKDQTR